MQRDAKAEAICLSTSWISWLNLEYSSQHKPSHRRREEVSSYRFRTVPTSVLEKQASGALNEKNQKIGHPTRIRLRRILEDGL